MLGPGPALQGGGWSSHCPHPAPGTGWQGGEGVVAMWGHHLPPSCPATGGRADAAGCRDLLCQERHAGGRAVHRGAAGEAVPGAGDLPHLTARGAAAPPAGKGLAVLLALCPAHSWHDSQAPVSSSFHLPTCLPLLQPGFALGLSLLRPWRSVGASMGERGASWGGGASSSPLSPLGSPLGVYRELGLPCAFFCKRSCWKSWCCCLTPTPPPPPRKPASHPAWVPRPVLPGL